MVSTTKSSPAPSPVRSSASLHSNETRTTYDEKPYEGPGLEEALQWLQVCIQSHRYCAESSQTQYRPTRLIDLGQDFDFSRARLIETEAGDSPVHYLTLSYCRGNNLPEEGKTYLSTLAENKFRLRRSKLPKTFKHFFAMAKIIGVQYVWIDSLCIIQDDDLDWQRESASMGQIYGNAVCTIAAESAKDARGGLWLESGFRIINGNTRQDITQQQNLENYISKCDQRFQKSALQKQGGALIERELSPRILHFTFAHIFWECRELKKDVGVLLGGCDSVVGSPAGREASSYEWKSTRLRAFDMPMEARTPQFLLPLREQNPRALSAFKTRQSPNEETIAYFCFVWRTIVEEFSTREFLVLRDRLPTISGLATEFQRSLMCDYMAGIWKDDLHGLLWATEYNMSFEFQQLEEGPSWSWASVPGSITYNWLHEALDYAGEDLSFPAARIAHSQVISIGSNPKGRCVSGLIQVMGKGRLITSRQDFLETRHVFFREDRIRPSPAEFSESNPILLLRILGSRGRGSFALVLKPSKEGWEGEFRRTGVMGGIADAWFDCGYDITVKIV